MSVTDQELIRLRNVGKIEWDRMVSEIITELLERRHTEQCVRCGATILIECSAANVDSSQHLVGNSKG
jgi:hypothetical protein